SPALCFAADLAISNRAPLVCEFSEALSQTRSSDRICFRRELRANARGKDIVCAGARRGRSLECDHSAKAKPTRRSTPAESLADSTAEAVARRELFFRRDRARRIHRRLLFGCSRADRR